jgi:hypothetical protein
VRWELGSATDEWRKWGHEQGVSADRWTVPGRQRPETDGRGQRARCARGRSNREGGERLTDGPRPQCWVAALTDRWAPAGGGRGREEREAWGARGPAEKEGGVLSPDE